MSNAGSPTQDKLDQLLEQGKITDEDYLRLSRAMADEAPSANAGMNASGAAEINVSTGDGVSIADRRLRKDWRQGLVGGLCAGYARYFGHDPMVARAILIIVFMLLLAWNGSGLILAPTYFLMCAFLPWDEPEPAREFQRSGRPKSFVAAAVGLWLVAPALFATLVLPRVTRIYESMGIDIWSSAFQNTLAGRAIDCASEYSYWLQPDNFVLAIGLCAAAMATLFLFLIYTSLCRQSTRRWFAWTVIGGGTLWLIFLLVGSLYPLAGMVSKQGL